MPSIHHPTRCHDQAGGLAANLPSSIRAFEPDDWYPYIPRYVEEIHRPVIAEDGDEWNLMTCSGLPEFESLHEAELVISIDGGCRDNGKPSAQCSAGVWFGRGEGLLGNRWNLAKKVGGKTSGDAELEAAIEGLSRYREILDAGARDADRTVLVKTDSQGMYKGIRALSQGDCPNDASGWNDQPQERWDFLENLIAKLEDDGIQFLFLWVPRDWNTDADNMAAETFRDLAKDYSVQVDSEDSRSWYSDEDMDYSDDGYGDEYEFEEDEGYLADIEDNCDY